MNQLKARIMCDHFTMLDEKYDVLYCFFLVNIWMYLSWVCEHDLEM